MDLRGRLHQARKHAKLSVYEVQKRLAKDGVPGSGYGSVYSYFNGQVEPPLAFLRALAALCAVRETWLISEEGGMTTDEAKIRRAQEALEEVDASDSPLLRELAIAVPHFDQLPRAGRAALLELLRRYMTGFYAPHGKTEYQIRSMASALFELVHHPLRRDPPGFLREPGAARSFESDEEYEDYLLLMCAALMRAIPKRGAGELVDGAYPRGKEPLPAPAPPRKREKRGRVASQSSRNSR